MGELERDHAVSECPQGPRSVAITIDGRDQRCGRPVFHTLGKLAPRQRLAGHHAVEMGMVQGPCPVDGGDGDDRIVAAGSRSLERLGRLGEAVGDEGHLELVFVGDVLVQRRRLDAELGGDGPHRQAGAPLALEEPASDGNDLIMPTRWHGVLPVANSVSEDSKLTTLACQPTQTRARCSTSPTPPSSHLAMWFVPMDSGPFRLTGDNHRVDRIGGPGRWVRPRTNPMLLVALAMALGASCSGDVTETTAVSSTTGVPATTTVPGIVPGPETTTTAPALRVSLEQVFGGSVTTEAPPTPVFAGDMTYIDGSDMAAVAVGGPGLVAGGAFHSAEVEGNDAAVWTSTDGRGWQRVVDDAGVFGDAESGAGSDQYITDLAGGSLGVVAVGTDGLLFEHDGAVWVSPDGLVWERLADDSDVFGGEGDQFMHAVVQTDGAAVVVGESAGEAAVWVSADGREWTRGEVNDASVGAGLEPTAMRDVAAAGDGLVAVGVVGAELGRPAVWLSADGVTWNRLLDEMAGADAGFDVVMGPMTAIAGGEEGFVAIGTRLRVDDDPSYADRNTMGPAVWVSVDGFEWRLLDATFVALPDERETSRYAYMKRGSSVLLDDIVWDGDRMLAIGGYELAPVAEDIPNFVTLWTSTDGGVMWQVADELTLAPADCWCGAREFTRFGDTAVLVGGDAIAAGTHPNGWMTWAQTPAVWITKLPAQ